MPKITNNSSYTIFYKDENSDNSWGVAPGKSIDVPFDGINAPHLRSDHVLKLSNNCREIIVTNDAVEIKCRKLFGMPETDKLSLLLHQESGKWCVQCTFPNVANKLFDSMGGWKDKEFVERHSDWNKLAKSGATSEKARGTLDIINRNAGLGARLNEADYQKDAANPDAQKEKLREAEKERQKGKFLEQLERAREDKEDGGKREGRGGSNSRGKREGRGDSNGRDKSGGSKFDARFEMSVSAKDGSRGSRGSKD